MVNEVRYYLEQIKKAIEDDADTFTPKYLVVATKLPTGAIELAVNNEHIPEKIDYILEAYDENMCLKSSLDVSIEQLMVV